MKLIRRQVRTPIGIDVSGRYIHAVQLRQTATGWCATATADLERSRPGQPMDGGEVARLEDVLARQGFVGSDAVLAVPPDQLLTNILELPPHESGAPVDQIARIEIGRMHDRQPDSFEMASWLLPAPARARKGSAPTMVAACGHAEADAYLDLFERQGLNIMALDVEACAFARALNPLLEKTAAMSAVLKLGWSSGLLLLLHGGVVVYQRDLPEAGLGRLHKAMVEQLGLDAEMADYVMESVGFASDEEDWKARGDLVSKLATHFRAAAEEVQVSLSYAAHQYPTSGVEQLLLVGAGAGIPGLSEHMAASLSAEVETVRLAQVVECPADSMIDGEATGLTKAVGLAKFFSESAHG